MAKLKQNELRTLWLIAIIFYAIDLLVITPFGIIFCGLSEVGLINSIGVYLLGIVWFPIWFVMFSWLMRKLFNFIDNQFPNRSKLILYVITITFCWLMLTVILSNLHQINLYCGDYIDSIVARS